MEESIFMWGLVLLACCYGLYKLLLAVAAEEEAKRRAGELAWLEWE